MKSPAVIYALKIQKEFDRFVSHEYEPNNKDQTHSTQESFESHSPQQKKAWFVILMVIVLFFVMTGAIIIFV